MERGEINGVPVWLKVTDLTGNERTIVKEAPGVDGAVIEVQGQAPQRYRLEFMLIQDGEWITSDAETATLELRSMLLSGGPFTVSIPTLGELTDLWLAEAYSIKFYDETRLTISEGSIALIEGQPYIILSDDAVSNVESAIGALSAAVGRDFARRAPAAGFDDGPVLTLDAFGEWLSDTQALISSAFEPVNDFSSDIQTLRGNLQSLLSTPGDFASRAMATAVGVLSLVPSLSAQGSQQNGSAAVQDFSNDKPAIVLVEALGTGAGFDDDVPTPQGETLGNDASEEDLEELDQIESARTTALAAVLVGNCLAITSTNFATVDSVLAVSEALEPAFERLFALGGLDYQVYAQARALRAATRKVLSDQAAGLPRLRRFVCQRDTDVLDILPDLYDLVSEDQVQAAVDSLTALNQLYDPMDIRRGTELRYLDPVNA